MSNRKALTLVEVTMAIAVISIAFYTLIAVYVTLAPRDLLVENLNKKIYLAQEKIEETLVKNFALIQSVAPTTCESASFNQYQYQIVVSYVATSDVNTPVPGPTNFKNVKAQVWGGANAAGGTAEITTLAVTYEVK